MAPLAGRKAVPQPGVRQHHPRPCVLHHEREAGRRIGWIEGHVGASRLEDRQQADDEIERARGENPDPLLGPDTEAREDPRQALGAGVQLPVGQARSAVDDRHGAGSPRGLRREQIGERGVRQLDDGVVPLPCHLVQLRLGQQEERIGRRLGVRGGAVEQRRELGQQAPGGRGVEEIGVVLQAEGQAVLDGRHEQGEVHLRGPLGQRRRLQHQLTQGEPRPGQAEGEPGQACRRETRCLLLDEHDLEQGRTARVPDRLQTLGQPRERHRAVREGGEQFAAQSREPVGERSPGRRLGAYHHRVHVVAHGAGEPGGLPPGGGHADQQILLPGKAGAAVLVAPTAADTTSAGELGLDVAGGQAAPALLSGALSPLPALASRTSRALPPRKPCVRGRRRSVGSSSCCGEPASRRRQ